MQEKYLVSVIIPVYNSSLYLQDILDDVKKQTYKNLEIIVIDDGSSDNSLEIARENERTDQRIQVYSFQNGGQSRARNIGLRIAKGQFIRFIDADDRVPADSIENMLSPVANSDSIDMVIGNFISNSPYGLYSGNELENTEISDRQFAQLLLKTPRAFYFGAPWNKLYRADIIRENHILFDEGIAWCEDLLFNLEYYQCCKKIHILNCKSGVYQYFVRDTGATGVIKNNKVEEARIEEIRYQKLLEYFEQYDLQEELKLGWKYINFYYRLTNCVKRETGGRSLRKRYKAFAEMLTPEDAYEYRCLRENDYDPRVHKMLKKAMEKKQIHRMFLIFLFKSWMASHFTKTMTFIRKHAHLRIPTDY